MTNHADPQRQFTLSTGQLSALVASAMPKHGIATLKHVLEHLSDIFNAVGCVIWETYPGGDPVDPKTGHLFALAAWFRGGEIFALHDLRIDGSLTGLAVTENLTLRSADIQRDSRITSLLNPIYQDIGVGPMLASPFTFSDGKLGAVSLYRLKKNEPFDFGHESALSTLAPIVPALYQLIQGDVSLKLLSDVNQILLERIDLPDKPNDLSGNNKMKNTLDQVCERVAQTFHSLEVSIFLQDPTKLKQPKQEYHLAGTSWPQRPYPNSVRTKHPSDGITSWTLYHAKPVIIFDLTRFRGRQEFYQKQYPGLTWSDSLGIVAAAEQQLTESERLDLAHTLPPISYMATPIFRGRDVIGVIRCSAGNIKTYGPYLFGKRDLELLMLVGGEVSGYWTSWLEHCRIIGERAQSEALAFTDLRHQLHGPLNQMCFRTRQLWREGDEISPELAKKLQFVEGLARKTRSVAMSIGFLASRDEESPPPIALTSLDMDTLRKLLIELAKDNELMIDPDRQIRFSIDHTSLEKADLSKIKVNHELLMQAVSNLLDNAGKYSHAKSTVWIRVGNTGSGNFHISIANRGIVLRPEEIRHLGVRGYRTEEAMAANGSGSGIGLWIVRRIMAAHHGQMEVIRTNRDQMTEFKLILTPAE